MCRLQAGVLIIYLLYERGVYMIAEVKKWGNSQGIRMSKEILQSAGIAVNDQLNVQVTKEGILLSKPFRHKTLEERAEAFGGELHLDGEFDWGNPVGREVW